MTIVEVVGEGLYKVYKVFPNNFSIHERRNDFLRTIFQHENPEQHVSVLAAARGIGSLDSTDLVARARGVRNRLFPRRCRSGSGGRTGPRKSESSAVGGPRG